MQLLLIVQKVNDLTKYFDILRSKRFPRYIDQMTNSKFSVSSLFTWEKYKYITMLD